MKILSWIVRYKFIIAILLFISYLSFSENSIFLNIRLKKEIKKLETENEFLSFQNQQMKLQNELMREDKDALELYMREYFFLKKENEEIFRINYVEEPTPEKD
ncbi:MAG: septum formation initiator family protein [Bacteroidales bacterium]|jgi:cell division protein FtsB|nr:septum formation initiator family protein [Bacteroidales bacterium]OQA92802.1 MAG: Cell division protein FtsB [Bacteroidetes bacterium ADurb.Bin234]MDD3331443.1 septum formation initiator family protein [Bacteroidales bacterium]MDD3692239.1 septum formation initiator family protein [Bacteroidales bacterium]MDD4045491.1 septum formation initiator family protein [Bacteroidales bacterium]